MKIALINENSQGAKNAMILNSLKKVVEPMGQDVYKRQGLRLLLGGRMKLTLHNTLENHE